MAVGNSFNLLSLPEMQRDLCYTTHIRNRCPLNEIDTINKTMEITKSLQKILLSTRGVQHIFITDKEGVPIIGVNESGEEDFRNRMQLINSSQIAVEQIAKLNLGEQKSAIFCYESTSVVVLNINPLLVIIIASSDTSIGTLRNLRHPLEPIINEIATAISAY